MTLEVRKSKEFSYASLHRYADFICMFKGQQIDLDKELRLFKTEDGKGIGRGVKPWVMAGVAEKTGPRKYVIDNRSLEWQHAHAVLECRRKIESERLKKKLPKQHAPLTEQQAVDFLKSKGYRILKPETQYTEI